LIVEQGGGIRVVDGVLSLLLLDLAELEGLLKLPILGGGLLLGQRPFTLLDGPPQIVFVDILPSRSRATGTAVWLPSALVLVARNTEFIACSIVSARPADHTIAHRSPGAAFFAKAALVYEEIADVLGLLPDVGTLVFAVLVHVLELLEGLDDVYVVAEVDDDVLGALVQTIVEDGETLSGA
jgi:hypothetical protein